MRKNICCSVLAVLLIVTAAQAQDTWVKKNPTGEPETRTYTRLANISSDKVLLFGGHDQLTADNLGDTWVYTLSSNIWEEKHPSYLTTVTGPPTAGSPITGRHAHSMSYIGDDKILLYGGFNPADFGAAGETWIYDLSDDTWTKMFPSGDPGARVYHTMASIGNNKVVLFGGLTTGSFQSNDTWVYDLTSNTWTDKNPATKPDARLHHAMSNIGGDKVLLFGGEELDEFGNTILTYNDTWVYDESDNNWVLKNPVSHPSGSARHGMASLGGGKALFFDGTSWIYDLINNNWTLSTAVTDEVSWGEPGMASIGNNKVVAFGGTPLPESKIWLFTAASMPWCDGTVASPHRVYICHKGKTICVELSALAAHLKHGDDLGPCISFTSTRDEEMDEEQEKRFSIYPNPGNGHFIVSLDVPGEHTGNRMIHITNSNGQTVEQINTINQNKISIDLKEPGVYFVQLITNKEVVTKKLVVVH